MSIFSSRTSSDNEEDPNGNKQTEANENEKKYSKFRKTTYKEPNK